METIIEQIKNAVGKIEEKYFCRNERDFAYELYYQLRQNIYPDNVEVTCETSKKRFSITDKIFDNKLIKQNFFREFPNDNRPIYRYPDLLVHEYHTRDKQLLALEIKKRYRTVDIQRDIAKLIVYCKGSLKYKKGILILIDTPPRNIIEIPDIRRMLEIYPEIEIWIVRPNRILEIICSDTI